MLRWKRTCAIVFLIYCIVFHLAVYAVVSNPLLFPLCGWIVVFSTILLAIVSLREEKSVFYWSVFNTAFCGVAYLLANVLALSAPTLVLCLSFPLLGIQVGLSVTSLRLLQNFRSKEKMTDIGTKSASVLQLFVASSVIAAAMALLRNLPLFYIFSPAWVSYAIFTANCALIATRVTAILESENNGLHASSVG